MDGACAGYVCPCIREARRPGLSEAVQGGGPADGRGDLQRAGALSHCPEKYFERIIFAQQLGLEKKQPELWLAAAKETNVRPEDCTIFDDSLAACWGARAAKMRVVGVYDGFFAQDEKEMRAFCDVYIKSFEELLWLPEQKAKRK